MQRDMSTNLPALWLGDKRGYLTDWVTQKWVRLSGRIVNLKAESWLQGQIGDTRQIGESYFEKLSQSSSFKLNVNPNGAGLIEDLSVLQSGVISSDKIHTKIRDFYEHTTKYNLDVWSQWCGVFKPFGWLIAALFSRRLQQLNMPISPLETSRGITSDIIQLADESGAIVGTGWLRKMIATSSVIYAGIYSTCKPPKFPGRCMKVVFPLQNVNATVIMKPQQHSDGSLTLISSGNGFGEPGFYFIVRKNDDEAWVKYLHAMKESIYVYVDDAGELRADHILKLWGATFLKLRYRMRFASPTQEI
jgi:hypothetical protein